MEFPRGLATPPSSGHRHGGTSTEMIPGSAEFYHREPHREGAPAPLCYEPCSLRPIRSSDRLAADWETILRPKVLSAMYEYDISPRSILPIRQLGALYSPVQGGNTILISAPSHKHKNNNWFFAVSDIRRFFISVGWTALTVEISDYEEMRLHTWAIRRDEPIVEHWAHIREVLMKQLMVDEAAVLESISIFRRGKSEERTECPLTIVLTAPEVYGLMIIKDQIRRTLDSNGYGYIGLEIVRDRLTRNTMIDIDPFSEDNYQLGAGMGASIGPKNSFESGTLGGYIYLRHPLAYDTDGINAASAVGRTVTLTQPSRADHDDIVKERESHIATVEGDIEKIRSALADMEMKILYGIKSENHAKPIRSSLDRQESQLLELRQLLSSGGEFYSQTSDFGHVFAASGFNRSPEKHQLDWALILPNETRQPPNSKVPVRDDRGREISLSNMLHEPTCPPTLEGPVWKKGRTTGFTRGTISHLKTDVFLDGMASNQPSTEWVIVGEKRNHELFSLQGDSGSMILNRDGQLVGLLIGGCAALGFTYMTPFATLVADIERKTGGKVEVED